MDFLAFSFWEHSPRVRGMNELETLRHSCAHILATAILRIWPEAQFAAGPPVEGGFYYDVELPHRITPEDFPRIEEEMRREVKANHRFERVEIGRTEALAMTERGELAALGARGVPSKFKKDILEGIPEGETITLYRNGDFTDLCAGPHVSHTGRVGAFRLTHVASAYYKGDENNPQLQRIYGTAFKNKTDLETHFAMLEEAKKRDHRRLGREMRLFLIDDSVGQGLVLWTPRGAVIRQELQDFIGDELRKQGYQQVFTPHIGKLDLYRTSGHFPYYADSQFPPLIERETLGRLADEGCSCSELANRIGQGDIGGFLLKPMNCPMHIKIYDSQPRSYRELPVRLAEFGTVYRWEQSGELGGMTRVRGFTQDDAHIFCAEDQVAGEIRGCLGLVKIVLDTLGMREYRVRVGLRDPDSAKYTGEAAHWDKAEAACRDAASGLGVPFTEEPGEAAFYGPKIDFIVKDVLGREWQLGTVQVDYNLPERFDLWYHGAEGARRRPVMIHRAPFGSLERFTGVLIEHFAGNFPLWLAPEQARILPINTDDPALMDYAHGIEAELRGAGIRCSTDSAGDRINAKIARAEAEKVHTMLVIGKRDAEAGAISLRVHGQGNLGAKPRAEVIAHLIEAIRSRAA